ncbi:MAG: glycosyltransferase family 2 protein [Candidatus Diapherotrites archaeon]
MKRVSIIVLNWNGKQWMEKCLSSIKKNTTYPDYEVIVVDNGSKDGSVELLEKLKTKGYIDVLIKNSENMGFAYANNQGFAKARGNYYFMLNNDTLVTKDWLKNAVRVLESNSRIAAVGSKLIQEADYDAKEYDIKPDVEKQTTCGAAMLMRKDVTDKIGILDAENFSPIYGEETDWCYRARNAGFKIMETDSSRVVHLGSVDTKRQTGKEWQYTLMNTNRLKAMLYNLGPVEFTKHVPGLGLIFVRSIKDGMLKYLLESYWNNVKMLGHTLKERKKRKLIAKKIKKENSQK